MESGSALQFDTNGVNTALTLDTSQNATFTGNVEIDGNLTVDGQIIHGGGGGIFNGNKAITSGASGVGIYFDKSR